jgi:hypothetical protein
MRRPHDPDTLSAVPRRCADMPWRRRWHRAFKDWRPENCVGQIRLPGCKADLGLPDITLEARPGRRGENPCHRCGEPRRSDFPDLEKSAGSGAGRGLSIWPRACTTCCVMSRILRRWHGQPGRHCTTYAYRRWTFRLPMACPARASVCLPWAPIVRSARCTPLWHWMRRYARGGLKSTFRATGQTGILITGDGVPLDAVIADFMAGSIEYLTPDNDPDHWDLIEGQGSLFHVSYSGVTMALIHGGQPDALILSHEPTRTHMRGLPDYTPPSLQTLRDTALRWHGSPTRHALWPGCRSTRSTWVRMKRVPTSQRSRRGLGCQRWIRSGTGPPALRRHWRSCDLTMTVAGARRRAPSPRPPSHKRSNGIGVLRVGYWAGTIETK